MLVKKYILVFALAFFARLLFGGFFWGLDRPAVDDGAHYREIASYISSGHGFADRHGPTSFRPPSYPCFLAFLSILCGPGAAAARVCQYFLGSVSCLLLFYCMTLYFGDKAGLLAGLISACYPLLIYLPSRFLSENLLIFFLLTGLILLFRPVSPPGGSRTALAGIVFGLAALTRPLMLAAPIFLLPWFLMGKPRGKPGHFFLFLFCFSVTVLPWTLRNYVLYQTLVPVTTNAGHTFWGANSSWAHGGWKIPPPFWNGNRVLSYDISQRKSLSEDIQQDRMFFRAGMIWIKGHPVAFLKLLPGKLYRFWHFRQQPETEEVSSARMDLVSLLSYGPLFLFMVAGMILALRSWQELLPFYLLLLLFTVNTLIFYGDLRMRAPLEPVLIGFASFGILAAWKRFIAGERQVSP